LTLIFGKNIGAAFTTIRRYDKAYAVAEPDNIVLEHLRHIRGAIDDVRDDIREMKQGIGNLENQHANMSNRLDRMDVRIERIERRLDLTDA
jgi:archaellum component FlaC